MTDLRFPYRNTLNESVLALENKKPISSLTFKFEDDIIHESLELQEAILANKPSGTVECLKIRNFCVDQGTHEKCFDFYLRCLEGPMNETKIFFYCSFFPLTLADAEKFAGAIASNGNITALSLMGGKQGFFREEGTFECVFDAVLAQGAVRGLQLTLLSFNEVVKRASTKSSLATNTTLKELELNIIQPDASQVADEGMKELSKVLRVNRGLEKIDVCRGMMTNEGRRMLLESLRDNITLLKLNTTRLPLLIDPLQKEDPLEQKERKVLQSKINAHMEWNRLYKRCMEHHGCSQEEEGQHKQKQKTQRKRRISPSVYPTLLAGLANKPLALYTFLKEHNPQLLNSLGEHRLQQKQQQRKRKRKRQSQPQQQHNLRHCRKRMRRSLRLQEKRQLVEGK